MRNMLAIAALALLMGAPAAHATAVVNQDQKAYVVKVQGEGKGTISNHVVKAKSSLQGICTKHSFCTFEIPGSKVSAKKEGLVTIRDGKFRQ